MKDFQDTVLSALQDAAAFAREAWRDAFLSMGLCAAAWTAVIVAGHAAIGPGQADLLMKLGWGLMLFHLPLQGALYRLTLGGAPERSLGLGGLQFTAVEGRIVGVNLLLGFALFWVAVPAVLLSGLSYLLFRRFDGVGVGPFGHLEWWFLIASVFWAILLATLAYLTGRLALSSPISVEAERVSPFESWLLTARRGWTAAAAYALAHAPTLIAVLALAAFTMLEPSSATVGLHGPWPLPDALAAGVVIGALLAFLQAPMSVGVLTYLYDIWSEPAAIAAEAPVAEADPGLEEPAMAAQEAALEPANDPAPPLSADDHLSFTQPTEPHPSPAEAQEAATQENVESAAQEATPSPALETTPYNPPPAGRFAYEPRPWQAGRPAPTFTPVVEEPSPAPGPITITLPGKVSAASAALDGGGEAEHAEP